MVEVTLPLPEKLVEDARRFGQETKRDMTEVLAEALEMMWATFPSPTAITSPLSTLSDDEVLSIANAKMDSIQNQRLGELQAKGKADALTEAERTELLALLHIYQAGQLRKSQGLAEAVQRGLMLPLSS